MAHQGGATAFIEAIRDQAAARLQERQALRSRAALSRGQARRTLEQMASRRRVVSENARVTLRGLRISLAGNLLELRRRFRDDRRSVAERIRRDLHERRRERTARLRRLLLDSRSARQAHQREILAAAKRARQQRATSSRLRRMLMERSEASRALRDKLTASRRARKAALLKATREVAQNLTTFVRARNERMLAWKKVQAWRAECVRPAPEREAFEVGRGEITHEPEQGSVEEGVEARVLELVRAHPEGIALVEMESALGIARVRLGNVVRRLVEQGKLRREERTYYPVNEP